MPLITIPPIEIEIDIPDLVTGAVTLKRKAKLFTLIYNQATKALTLSWIVSYPELNAKGISSYSKESTADNTTMVNVQTGEVLQPEIITNAEGVIETTYPGNYIGQYDWFNYVAETQPLNVHDLIRQYGMQANWD